ncbi:replication protein RepA [Glutamicibacter ardleyensis]|uniref:replication protein RepA n=1 Tax=Glutamicibacter ardleyensis TaxID=225894 RepID=UPI003FD3BBD5
MVPENMTADTARLDENTSQKAVNTENQNVPASRSNTLKMTPRQKNFLDASLDIRERASDELSFGIDFLAETCLPIRDPGSDLRIYKKQNGNLTLKIRPAEITLPNGSEEFVYPYGVYPRRVLIWCVTEALRTRNEKLYLGSSLNDFIRTKLRLSVGGLQMKNIRKQTLALFQASISVTSVDSNGSLIKDKFSNFHIADEGELLTHIGARGGKPKDDEASYLVLNRYFFERIVGIDDRGGKAFPVDMRAVDAIGNDALALDIYLWTVLRVYRAQKGHKTVTVQWATLQRQFGAETAETYHFKQKFMKAINKIHLVYPGLNFESDRKTFTLLPSDLAIAEKVTEKRKPKLKNKVSK